MQLYNVDRDGFAIHYIEWFCIQQHGLMLILPNNVNHPTSFVVSDLLEWLTMLRSWYPMPYKTQAYLSTYVY